MTAAVARVWTRRVAAPVESHDKRPEGVYIGTRRGVVWWAWREPGESTEAWHGRAEAMREAFNTEK